METNKNKKYKVILCHSVGQTSGTETVTADDIKEIDGVLKITKDGKTIRLYAPGHWAFVSVIGGAG